MLNEAFDGKCRLIFILINDICSDSYLSRNTCYGCYQGVDHIHYLKIHRLVYLGFYFHKLYTTYSKLNSNVKTFQLIALI